MTKEDNFNHNSGDGLDSHPFGKGHFLPKMTFLGVISLALSNFGFFALFSSVPLALSHLLFGKTKSLIMCVLMTGALIAVSLSYSEIFFVTGVFFCSSVIAFTVSEGIKKFQPPVEVLIRGGLAILGVLVGLTVAYQVLAPMGIVETIESQTISTLNKVKEREEFQQILSSTSEQSAILNRFVRNPELMVKEVLSWIIPSTVISVFMWIWLTLIMLMRNSLVWKRVVAYPFSQRELLTFRMPFYWVYPVIIGLVLTVGSSFELVPEVLGTIGSNILFSLGIFYFFQGFGVFSDTLTYFRIIGFFRTLLTILMVFFAFQLIVLLGLFDTWVNFRKFLKNKKDN